MKIFIGALALALAVPAAAQTVRAADPHAAHAQHQQHQTGGQHGTAAGHDHASMMAGCKKAMAEGKCAEHCAAMMKQGAGNAAAAPATAHAH